jgi:hypothetical protein
VVEKDLYGERTEVAFDRSNHWQGGPRPYVTCWVFKPSSYVYRLDERGNPKARHLDWARDLIAQALGVNACEVWLGYDIDCFDVRPF